MLRITYFHRSDKVTFALKTDKIYKKSSTLNSHDLKVELYAKPRSHPDIILMYFVRYNLSEYNRSWYKLHNELTKYYSDFLALALINK